MQKLARVAFKTNNIDNCARICHGPSVAGLSLSFGSGAATNPPFEDLANTDLIFMIGANSVEAHPLAGRRILQAKKAGKTLIVCDPRYTPTARLADHYVRYNPSTNIALINSIMYWIIKENLHDKEFIEKRTKGFEDMRKVVEKYADVESITGVPTERVKEIARMYANANNAVIIYCLGITELSTGTDNVRSLGNLAMLTGNIGRPGVGVNPLRGQNNVQGACDMGAYPNVFSGYQKCEDPVARKRMEELWGGVTGLSSEYGVTLTEQINQCGDPIKAMYIFALNPVVSYPNANHVMKSLEKLDFLVVQDLFMTETAQYADVILPVHPSPRRTGRSPAPSGVSTVSGRPSRPPAIRRRTGRSSSTWPTSSASMDSTSTLRRISGTTCGGSPRRWPASPTRGWRSRSPCTGPAPPPRSTREPPRSCTARSSPRPTVSAPSSGSSTGRPRRSPTPSIRSP